MSALPACNRDQKRVGRNSVNSTETPETLKIRLIDRRLTNPSGDLAELDVSLGILERVVDPALGDLPKRVDEGLDLVALRVWGRVDRVGVPIEGVDDRHAGPGLGPLPVDQVLHRVRLGRRPQCLRVDRRPLGDVRHGSPGCY